jgi:hypothetical protein
MDLAIVNRSRRARSKEPAQIMITSLAELSSLVLFGITPIQAIHHQRCVPGAPQGIVSAIRPVAAHDHCPLPITSWNEVTDAIAHPQRIFLVVIQFDWTFEAPPARYALTSSLSQITSGISLPPRQSIALESFDQ